MCSSFIYSLRPIVYSFRSPTSLALYPEPTVSTEQQQDMIVHYEERRSRASKSVAVESVEVSYRNMKSSLKKDTTKHRKNKK